jgi:hypothetical protein
VPGAPAPRQEGTVPETAGDQLVVGEPRACRRRRFEAGSPRPRRRPAMSASRRSARCNRVPRSRRRHALRLDRLLGGGRARPAAPRVRPDARAARDPPAAQPCRCALARRSPQSPNPSVGRLKVWRLSRHARKPIHVRGFQNGGSVSTGQRQRPLFCFTRAREYQILAGFATEWPPCGVSKLSSRRKKSGFAGGTQVLKPHRVVLEGRRRVRRIDAGRARRGAATASVSNGRGVVVDLAKTAFIDSLTLGSLTAAAQEVRAREGFFGRSQPIHMRATSVRATAKPRWTRTSPTYSSATSALRSGKRRRSMIRRPSASARPSRGTA